MKIDTINTQVYSGNQASVNSDSEIPGFEPINISPATPTVPATPDPVSEKAIINAIEKANKIMINHNTKAEFSVHEKTKAINVKIVDMDNNQVIREFPPEKILDLIAKMLDMAGLFVDERR